MTANQNIDIQVVNKHIQTLKQQLKDKNMKAGENIVYLSEAIGKNYLTLFKELEKHVDHLSFDEALKYLQQLELKIQQDMDHE